MGEPDIDKMKAEKDVEGLIKALKDKDWDVRFRGALALEEMGEPVVESLIQALKEDKDEDVRGRAAAALGFIKDARAVEPLTKALEDKDKGVREAAKWALEKIEAKES